MKAILDIFNVSYYQKYKTVKEIKKTTCRKVIGCLPMYFPEEFIHAAGMIPVTLLGDNDPILRADRHLMINSCQALRGTFDNLLFEKYDFLDGIVALLVCDQIRFFFEIWDLVHRIPFFHQMWRPHNMGSSSREFIISELTRLKSALETFAKTEISKESFENSVTLYNKTRSLMRQLYELRREKPGLLKASELLHAVAASFVMPKEMYNPILENLLCRAQQVETDSESHAKVVVCGHPCAVPDAHLIETIEETGMTIVSDDFFSGKRYCSLDIAIKGDPILSYADYYLNAMPCTTYHYPDNWINGGKTFSSYADHVIREVRKNEAQGVIILKEMFCDPFDMECVLLKKKLEQEKIPNLSLTIEHGQGASESQKVRILSFSEMLTG